MLEALLPLEGTSNLPNLPILSRARKTSAFPPSWMDFANSRSKKLL